MHPHSNFLPRFTTYLTITSKKYIFETTKDQYKSFLKQINDFKLKHIYKTITSKYYDHTIRQMLAGWHDNYYL